MSCLHMSYVIVSGSVIVYQIRAHGGHAPVNHWPVMCPPNVPKFLETMRIYPLPFLMCSAANMVVPQECLPCA